MSCAAQKAALRRAWRRMLDEALRRQDAIAQGYLERIGRAWGFLHDEATA